jgi:hypothetical protein
MIAPRSLTAVMAALLPVAGTLGCAHFAVGGERPGAVDLARPPAVPAARGATLPGRPVATALAVSPGVLAGAGWRGVTRDGNNWEAALGFELGLHRARVKRLETTEDAQHDFGFEPDAWWGVNLGWTPAATRTEAPGPFLPPSTYVELQWSSLTHGLAGGVALAPGDLRRERTGLQVVPFSGPLYWRFQLLFDGTFVTELGLALKVPLLISF